MTPERWAGGKLGVTAIYQQLSAIGFELPTRPCFVAHPVDQLLTIQIPTCVLNFRKLRTTGTGTLSYMHAVHWRLLLWEAYESGC